MYGLIVKTGFGVWRLTFMCPHFKIGRQNQQNDCAPSEDSDQPGHPPSLIRVFAVRALGGDVESAITITLAYVFLIMSLLSL